MIPRVFIFRQPDGLLLNILSSIAANHCVSTSFTWTNKLHSAFNRPMKQACSTMISYALELADKQLKAKQEFFVHPLSKFFSIIELNDSISFFMFAILRMVIRPSSLSHRRPMANAQFMPRPALSLPSELISSLRILRASAWFSSFSQPTSSIEMRARTRAALELTQMFWLLSKSVLSSIISSRSGCKMSHSRPLVLSD